MFTNKPTAVFNRRYQASAAAYVRPSFFCDVMRRRLAVTDVKGNVGNQLPNYAT